MKADWRPYAGQGGWWKRATMPDAGRLLTGDEAARWAEQHADAKKPRRKRRGRK